MSKRRKLMGICLTVLAFLACQAFGFLVLWILMNYTAGLSAIRIVGNLWKLATLLVSLIVSGYVRRRYFREKDS